MKLINYLRIYHNILRSQFEADLQEFGQIWHFEVRFLHFLFSQFSLIGEKNNKNSFWTEWKGLE